MVNRRDILKHIRLLAFGIAMGLAFAPAAFSSEDGGGDDGGDDGGGGDGSGGTGSTGGTGGSGGAAASPDQDGALSSRQAGQAMPVRALVVKLQQLFGGEVIDIRLISRVPAIYDIKMVRDDGRVGSIRVDAKSNRIMRITGF